MPRKARLDAPGTLHHVIIRGIERRAIVDDDKDRENFVSRMGHLAFETGTGIFAWTVMMDDERRRSEIRGQHMKIKSADFRLLISDL